MKHMKGAYSVDVVHPFEYLAHQELGDRVTEFEIAIAQKSAHVVVHVWEDHEDLAPLSPIRVVLWTLLVIITFLGGGGTDFARLPCR